MGVNPPEARPWLSLEPRNLDFKSQTGQSQELFLTATNSGAVLLEFKDLQITSESVAAFQVFRDMCGKRSLAQEESCEIGLRYSSAHAGRQTAKLILSTNDPNSPAIVLLTGQSIDDPLARVDVSPREVAFETLEKRSQIKRVTIRNVGSAPLAVGSVAIDLSTAFRVESSRCSSRVLKAQESCEVSVEFFPQRAGE